MKLKRHQISFTAILVLAAIALPLAHSSPPAGLKKDDLAPKEVYSPYSGRDYPDKVLFGDSHFHTNLSFDAGLVGTTLDVDTGYRFARGEVIPAEDPSLRILTAQETAAGLHAVWARENTRGEIFDAMNRQEVYATTGTRIRVRLFAGWDFEADEVTRHDFVPAGYSRGVPMGGDLRDAPKGGAPRFMIRALRDPDGANIDRVQVIKGWVDDAGEPHERIYDVAVSDGREIDTDGRCKTKVGSTVDVEKATFTNTIGDAMMSVHWEDPDFDPTQHAFYYVRVLEIPTPRWTTYDAAFFKIKRPDIVPPTVQDRAYTSPVWYTP